MAKGEKREEGKHVDWSLNAKDHAACTSPQEGKKAAETRKRTVRTNTTASHRARASQGSRVAGRVQLKQKCSVLAPFPLFQLWELGLARSPPPLGEVLP